MCAIILHIYLLSTLLLITLYIAINESNINLHIEQVSSIDKRNFIYHCMLYWNACPIHGALPKQNLFNSVKLHKLAAYNIFQCYYYFSVNIIII